MEFSYKDKVFCLESFDEQDHIFKSVKRNKVFYELRFLEYIRILMEKEGGGGACLDIGANIGNHSIFFSAFLDCRVYSVEPYPASFSLLEKNVKNNCSEVNLFNMALGRRYGWGSTFLPEGSDKNLGKVKVGNEGEDGGSIRIMPLDEFVKQNVAEKHIYFLKIDVEGMEKDVIEGGKWAVEKYKPHIFAEAESEAQFKELSQFLEEFGYEPVKRFGATPMWHFCYQPSLLSKLKFMVAGRRAKRIAKSY